MNEQKETRVPIIIRSHVDALIQSMVSYWLGIAFGGVAIAGIVWAALIVEDVPIAVQDQLLILLLLGGLAAALSGLFLFHSSRARAVFVLIMDRLRDQWNVEEGVFVASTISDCAVRNRVNAEIALQLCRIEHPETKARDLLGRSPALIPRRSLGKFVMRRRLS